MVSITNKKVALVTGVAGGIGQATAKLLSEQGWAVVGLDLRENVRLLGVDHFISANLAEPESIARAVLELKQISDHLDVLVNNAAIQICKPILEMDVNEWDQIMDINLRSAFLLAQATHPLLKNCQGSIVNISSVHAIATSTNIAAYAASKGALTAFTRALSIEFAHDHIRVNAVLPGATNTQMLHSGLNRGDLKDSHVNQLLEQLAQKTVIGRIGDPREIAEAILFFAEPGKSSFITGQSLVIDGGATIRLSTE
jgi:NAD(P)-dependent dehydrogenase (short-subunit alcohol dehydrogenase family)